MLDLDNALNQLKQRLSPQKNNALALEINRDFLLAEISGLLEQLGFVSFTYGAVIRSRLNTDSEQEQPDHFDELISTVPQSVQDAYFADIVDHDLLWELLPKTDQPLIVDARTSHNSFTDTFWRKQGVNSRLFIPLEDRFNDYWFYYFGLNHKLQGDEFDHLLAESGPWLVPALNRYHQLLQSVAKSTYNPFLNRKSLSKTCLEVVRLTAEGLAVKSIADKLALTEEGITYHITRAKRIFGARNKTHLIAILYAVGVL